MKVKDFLLGLSTKTPGDRGQFGEGLKLLVAACLRNEIEVSLSSRNWQAKAKTHTINLPDYEKGENKTFPLLGFELDWRESERLGSESQFRLPENASEAAVNLWGALCKVVDPRQENALKESPAKGIDKFICSERRLFRSTTVEVLPDKQIYEHGLLVNTPNVDRQLGYNFHESITTTRERNDFDLDKAQRLLSDYANSNLLLCPEFARAFIVASVSGNSQCLEKLTTTNLTNNSVSAASRIAFSEVFGERALLSWKGRYSQIQNTLSQLTYSPFGLYGTYEDIPRQKQNLERALELARKIVANEIHLEGSHNLVLAANFYSLRELNLPSTQEVLQQFEEREVTINQEQEKVALETIKRTDAFIIERLERLLANENGAKVLANLGISQVNLEKYKQESLNRNPTQIRWQAPEWQILGEALPVGKQLFAYNTKLINNPYELAIIHKHEVCHRISGLRDYETKFQMLLLIFADEDLLRDVGVF
jgi:hypothetical protein